MEEFFPDPFTFDIDRYLPERQEHVGRGYAPFGLGTHTCLGSRWLELQLGINLLLMAHYFRFELTPKDYKLRINPIPSMLRARNSGSSSRNNGDLYLPDAAGISSIAM